MRFSLYTLVSALLIACSAAITPVLAAPQAAQTGPLPPIRLDPPEFNAGNVDSEELIEASFRVMNPTRKAMVIDGFTTSCKCTSPVITDRLIPAGGSVVVSANVDLRGTTGPINKSFTLKIRGYDREFPCTIKAVLGSKIAIEPARLTRTSGRIRLTSTDGRPFAPIAIHNKNAQYEFTPVSSPGAERTTVWDVTYSLPAGAADQNLLIETDHRKAPLLAPRLYVGSATTLEMPYIKQRHEIYSVRTHANLGLLNQGESYDLQCALRRPSHEKPIVPYTDTPGLDAELIEVTKIPGEENAPIETKMYTIRLTNNGTELGGILTPLYFRTPEDFETRIWLSALVHESDESAIKAEKEEEAESEAQTSEGE